MSKRSRAFSGCMKTIGPRSASRGVVARSLATRSGRLRVSSATVRSYDSVALARTHQQPPPAQCLERALHLQRRQAETLGKLPGRRATKLAHRLPGAPFFGAQCPDDVNTVSLFEHERQPAALEDGLDRLPVLIRHAAKEEVGLTR